MVVLALAGCTLPDKDQLEKAFAAKHGAPHATGW